MRRARSLIVAGIALIVGLAVWGIDDLLVIPRMGPRHVLHFTVEVIEVIVLGPGLAWLVWLAMERIRTQQERLAIAREQRFAALGRVAGAIAHEVRNPLHTLGLALEELEADGRIAGDGAEVLRSQLRRIAGAVTQVYALAAPPAGPGPSTPGDLARAARDAASRHPGCRAEVPAEARVACPDEALDVIVDNLVRNALAAGGRAVLTVQPGEDDGWRLLVRNPGILPPGIAEDDGAAPAPVTGLGLGLFIARQLAARADGTLALHQDGGEVEAMLTLATAP